MTVAAARPPLADPLVDLDPVILGPCRCRGCGEQLVWCGLHWHIASTFGTISTPWAHACPKAAR